MYRFETIDNSLVNLLKLIRPLSTYNTLKHETGIKMILHRARVNSNNWIFWFVLNVIENILELTRANQKINVLESSFKASPVKRRKKDRKNAKPCTEAMS